MINRYYDVNFCDPTEEYPMEYKLVPIIPTEEMIQAACVAQWCDTVTTADKTYENWKNGMSNQLADLVRTCVTRDYIAMIGAAPCCANANECPESSNLDVVEISATEYEDLISGHNAMVRDIQDRLKPICEYIESSTKQPNFEPDMCKMTATEALARVRLVIKDMDTRLL